jgi:predicted ATP-grasp superfamily ATP-dependent carboligase
MSDRVRRILVTDAHATSALSIVRSLGSLGIEVTVAVEEGRFGLASRSRHATRTVRWPHAETHPGAYVRSLEQELQRARYDLLVPASDTVVTLVRHHRARLEALVDIALPPNEVLDLALDKAATVRLADEVGVATPCTRVFESLAAVASAAPRLLYPCVVKPRFSRRWNGGEPLTRGTVEYANNPEELRAIFDCLQGPPESVLVQQFVRGTGVGVFVLAEAGRPLAVFAHRRLREANPAGGRASLAESIAADERLLAPALRLLAASRWSGVAMVEMKDPGAPAPPVLMEINGRFWGSLPLALAAGVDFPRLLVQLMCGQAVEEPPSYRIGVRCRHLRGDLKYLGAALKGPPAGWHEPFPTRCGALSAVISWPGRWCPYTFSLRDPLPGLCEAADLLATHLRLLASRGAEWPKRVMTS